MLAARIHKFGRQSKVCIDRVEKPVCNKNEVLVELYASSINHLDLWVKKGIPGIKINLPFTLGSDGAGVIVEIGENVKDWKIGDKIIIQPGIFCGNCLFCKMNKENQCLKYGILGETHNGTHCEYIALDSKYIYPKFSHLSFQEAASIPLTYMTAYEMLVAKAKLSKNENVLIYGATSGVGNAAIKIAKSIGAKIISTVGSENKIDFAKKAGSDFVFLHNENDLYSKIKAITGHKGIHVVFEHIGKDTWQNSLKLLSKGGRIVTCGSTTGSKVSIDLQHLFYKQQSILGSTMSSINEFEKMMKFVNNNQISPSIDRVFNLDRINNAYKYIEERNHKGKIVISINDKSNTL